MSEAELTPWERAFFEQSHDLRGYQPKELSVGEAEPPAPPRGPSGASSRQPAEAQSQAGEGQP